MDTKKLKQKILDLAVRGKLVPQDPSDEPASVLLERIRTEKEQLIRDKKIKRDKNESHIYRSGKSYYEKRGSETVCIDEEIPFEIPESWEWCRFGVVSNYGECNTTKASDIKATDWILDLEDIEKDSGRIVKRVTQQEKQSLSNKHSFSAGQLLYSKLRPYLNKVVIAVEDGYCTTEIIPINFNGWVLPKYGQIFLMSYYFLTYANMLSYGVKMPRMGTSDGRKVLFPLAPISEQIRIISQVESLLSLVDNVDNNKVDLQIIIQQTKAKVLDLAIRGKLVPQDPTDEPASILLERIKTEKKTTAKPTKRDAKNTSATSDNSHYENVPFEVPDSWVWCTIGDVCIFDNGYAFNSKDYSDQGVPIIRISNIKDGYIDIDNCVYTNCDNNIRDRFSVRKGNLLIAMSGATTGKMGIYNSDELSLLNQRVGNLKIKHSQILSQEYRNILISGCKSAIITKAYGGAQPNISSNDILTMKIAIPPLSEQQRISAIVKHLFSTLDRIEESLS